jgi:hypothetical protein
MGPSRVDVEAVTPDIPAWKGSAQEARLSYARGIQELPHRSHNPLSPTALHPRVALHRTDRSETTQRDSGTPFGLAKEA